MGAAERRITLIDEVLTGQRVRLRPVQPADEQALMRIFTDREVARWWGDPSRSVRDVLHPEEGESCFMVEVGADVVGMIQCVEETDPMYEHAGIDIALHSNWQGKGRGTGTPKKQRTHTVSSHR